MVKKPEKKIEAGKIYDLIATDEKDPKITESEIFKYKREKIVDYVKEIKRKLDISNDINRSIDIKWSETRYIILTSII